MVKEKVIVMLSGGLDSRLVVKLLQEQGKEILALHFKLPFGTGCCDENCSFNFAQMSGVKLKIFDCTKGKLLQGYLDVIKKAKHGRGAGVNPCVDCRIFMLKKAKEFADKKGIKLIATGEVLGERPMSQNKKAMETIEKESGLKGRLIRPLCDLGIKGRKRDKQITLAKKFKIDYPHPAGGCALCEKELKKRFMLLLERGLDENTIGLATIGRHFIEKDSWIVLGRNKKENDFIGKQKGIKIIPKQPGASAWVDKKKYIEKAKELIQKYSKHKIKEFDVVDED